MMTLLGITIIITNADASSGRRFGLPSSIHRQRPANPIFGGNRALDHRIFLVSRGGGGDDSSSSSSSYNKRDGAWEEEIRRTREFYGSVVTEMRQTILVAAASTTDVNNTHASVTANDAIIGSVEAGRNVFLESNETNHNISRQYTVPIGEEDREEVNISDYEVEDSNIDDIDDTGEQIIKHEPSTEEEQIRTVVHSSIADEDAIGESIAEEEISRAKVIHAVAVEGSRVVSKEYNIIIDDDDDDSNTDDIAMNGLAATSSTAMEMTDINLEQLLSPRFHHRNLEVKPVEEIFSLDKSYTRGLFAWSRRMVERRISSSLLGRHLKVVIPIVLTSVVGVVLSLLVATSDKQGKTLLRAEDNLNEEDETSDD